MAVDMSRQSFLTFGTIEGECLHDQTILFHETVFQNPSNRVFSYSIG